MLQEHGMFRRSPLDSDESGRGGPETLAGEPDEKLTLTPVARFRVPIGGQEVELQQVDYVHGGMSLLRLRIREGRRFTIFDIDSTTARHWGELLCRWADGQAGAAPARRCVAAQVKEKENNND